MKHYPVRPPRPRPVTRRIPAFHAVPGRARSDGWTPQRQAEFIGYLFETRSVARAAECVNMARETAYRLRRRPWSESFCAAWDAALGLRLQLPLQPPRKVTIEELRWRAETGLWKLRIVNGRYGGVWHRPDNSALLSLLGQLGPERYCAAAEGHAA